MKKSTLAAAVSLALFGAAEASTVDVINNADSGPGSFRAAVEQANTDAGVDTIKFLDSPHLTTPVIYIGAQHLLLRGNGFSVNGNTFESTTAGSIEVSGLTFKNSVGDGLKITSPIDLNVNIVSSYFQGNEGFGALIGQEVDTDASVNVSLVGVQAVGNGLSITDKDGIRIQEKGPGNLVVTAVNSLFNDNGGDGLETDETGPGDNITVVALSKFNGNGGTNPLDLEDGLDTDENGPGKGVYVVYLSEAVGNFSQGFDFDTDGGGDFTANVVAVNSELNYDDGFKFNQKSSGNLNALLTLVTAIDNGDKGIQVEEEGEGNLAVSVSKSTSIGNTSEGLLLTQELPGVGFAKIESSDISGNGGGDIVTENVTILP